MTLVTDRPLGRARPPAYRPAHRAMPLLRRRAARPLAGTRVAPRVTRPMARTGWPSLAIDASLALALASLATFAGLAPARIALILALTWPLMLLAAGCYHRDVLAESRREHLRVVALNGVRGGVLTLAASSWLTGAGQVDLALLVVSFCVASGAHHLIAGERHQARLVLVGRQDDVREAIDQLAVAGAHDVVAVCLTGAPTEPLGDVAAYVGPDAAAEIAERHAADVLVVLPGSGLSPQETRRLQWALGRTDIGLCLGTGLLDVRPRRTHVLETGGLTLVRADHASLRGPRRWLKEALERAAAGLGLLVLSPALLVIAVLIRRDSPGPAIYRQQRVGRHGRLFTMYKFRSMTVTADVERGKLTDDNQADGVLFKIRRDPRITRTGAWLRRTSLDELPQLWNVVRGDMSLVGPRPALPEEVAKYDLDPRRRLVVKPGMTGLWQVSGRSDLSWAESVRLDVRYVDNWSLGLDLSILARTIRAVVAQSGAY